jgi:hypothetical protein
LVMVSLSKSNKRTIRSYPPEAIYPPMGWYSTA